MEFVIYSVHAADVYLCILQWQLKLAPFLFHNRQGAVWSQDIKGIKLILKEFQGSEGVSEEGGHSTGPKSSFSERPSRSWQQEFAGNTREGCVTVMCSSRRLDNHLNINKIVEVTENKPKNTFSAGSGMSDAISDF